MWLRVPEATSPARDSGACCRQLNIVLAHQHAAGSQSGASPLQRRLGRQSSGKMRGLGGPESSAMAATEQTSQNTDGIPQQCFVRAMMNVGLHHRRADTQARAVFHAEIRPPPFPRGHHGLERRRINLAC